MQIKVTVCTGSYNLNTIFVIVQSNDDDDEYLLYESILDHNN